MIDLYEYWEGIEACRKEMNSKKTKNKEISDEVLKPFQRYCDMCKESMRKLEMYVPVKVREVRFNKKNREMEFLVAWAMFEDDANQHTWETENELPDWFLEENKESIRRFKNSIDVNK